MTFVDIQAKVCKVLIDAGIANGQVYVADETQIIKTMPIVFVTQTNLTGRPADGFYEATVVVNCIANYEYAAGVLSSTVLDVLDGYGGNGIADATHVSTYPIRTSETSPATHTNAMTFRVLYQNLKK